MEDAKAAKESCNGIEIDGRRIRVDFSITQRAHTPTPGIYMGKPTYDNRFKKKKLMLTFLLRAFIITAVCMSYLLFY